MPIERVVICDKCKKETRQWHNSHIPDRFYQISSFSGVNVFCDDCIKFVFVDDIYVPAAAYKWLFNKDRCIEQGGAVA